MRMLDIITNLNHNTPPIVDEKSFIAVHKPRYVLDPIEVDLKVSTFVIRFISLSSVLNI